MKLGKMEQQESCVDFNHLDVDKELKNTIIALSINNDPELVNYKLELEKYIELRDSKNDVLSIRCYSQIFNENYTIDKKNKRVVSDTGEKYSFQETDRMVSNNWGEKDIKLLHLMKSKFNARFTETENKYTEGLFTDE